MLDCCEVAGALAFPFGFTVDERDFTDAVRASLSFALPRADLPFSSVEPAEDAGRGRKLSDARPGVALLLATRRREAGRDVSWAWSFSIWATLTGLPFSNASSCSRSSSISGSTYDHPLDQRAVLRFLRIVGSGLSVVSRDNRSAALRFRDAARVSLSRFASRRSSLPLQSSEPQRQSSANCLEKVLHDCQYVGRYVHCSQRMEAYSKL